jgi:hypothetical protein
MSTIGMDSIEAPMSAILSGIARPLPIRPHIGAKHGIDPRLVSRSRTAETPIRRHPRSEERAS